MSEALDGMGILTDAISPAADDGIIPHDADVTPRRSRLALARSVGRSAFDLANKADALAVKLLSHQFTNEQCQQAVVVLGIASACLRVIANLTCSVGTPRETLLPADETTARDAIDG